MAQACPCVRAGRDERRVYWVVCSINQTDCRKGVRQIALLLQSSRVRVRTTAKRRGKHQHQDNLLHLVACELVQRLSGRWQPQDVFNHERIELLVFMHVVLELVSSQFHEERAALFVALGLDKSIGKYKKAG